MKKFFNMLGFLIALSCLVLTACDREAETSVNVLYNIEALSLSSCDDIVLKAGEEHSGGYVRVTVRDRDKLSADDVEFVSENENVAAVSYVREALGTHYYYKITAVGDGETYIYAKARLGGAVSEKVRVSVKGVLPGTASEATSSASLAAPMTVEAATTVAAAETVTAARTVAATGAGTAEKTLRLVSVTSPCISGTTATLIAVGKPDTVYTISVYYSSGASKSKGLEAATSDASGNVSWTWMVGANTKEGEHEINISGGGETLKTSFVTYKKTG